MIPAINAYHQESELEPRSWRGILDTTLCDKVYQWLATGRWFSPGTLVSSINKNDYHDIPGNWNIVESGVKHHKPKPLSK